MTLRSSSGQEVSHGDPRCDKQSTKTLWSPLSHLQSELEQTDEAEGEDEEWPGIRSESHFARYNAGLGPD